MTDTKAKENPKTNSQTTSKTTKQSAVGIDNVFYGNSAEVVAVGHQDYNDFIKNGERKQQLIGFDDQYRDIVDYILKITHRIWEEKGIGIIYDTYHNDVTMHTSTTNLVGIKDVVANTLQTLHAFPDRRLIGEEVIWSYHEAGCYLSSHRVLSTATNLGDSSFGKATGKKVNFRTVIDCAIEKNRIYEEWLVRDNLWLVQQLGYDVNETAKKLALNHKNKIPSLQANFGLAESMDGQFMPPKYEAKDNTVGEWIKQVISEVYNYKMINKVKMYYGEEAVVHHICNHDLYGHETIQGMIISLLSSIPNGHYYVERVTVNNLTDKGHYSIAVRWRLKGLHEGLGTFGEASYKPLNILGITHYTVKNFKIYEEWITYDGLDVLRQIYQDYDNDEALEGGK